MLSAAEKAQRVLQVLEGWYGAATTELRYRNPYELAVAVVLSAQCTDVRVHQTTPAFFERFPDCETLARAEPAGVFSYIRRAGPMRGLPWKGARDSFRKSQ